MKPVKVNDEYFEKAARRLENAARWKAEHPVRSALICALDLIIGSLKYLRNRLRQ